MKNESALRRALVIQHIGFEDLGTLAPALISADFAIEYRQAGVTDLSQPPTADLLIVLGGPIGVYEQTRYPFLADELRLITEWIAAGKPIIGICLGAQLMAAAMGATVFPGEYGKEVGWSPIYSTTSASTNLLLPLFKPGLNVLHWHGDTFELPTGATRLACSQQYENQAFALDTFGLALQFHAEVDASQMERWFIGHAAELSQARISVPSLRADSKLYAPALEVAATELWRH